MWTNYSLCSVSNKEMLKVDFLGFISPAWSGLGSISVHQHDSVSTMLLYFTEKPQIM